MDKDLIKVWDKLNTLHNGLKEIKKELDEVKSELAKELEVSNRLIQMLDVKQ